MKTVCLTCKYSYKKDLGIFWCKLKEWPIPFAEERSAVGNVPCWCPFK